jgi:hypothetical protein
VLHRLRGDIEVTVVSVTVALGKDSGRPSNAAAPEGKEAT